MELNVTYICECNQKEYASLQALRVHKKTKGHKSWEQERELRLLKVSLTERDNEIVQLEYNIIRLKELNSTLIARIQLEK